jgi:hypothetical protein
MRCANSDFNFMKRLILVIGLLLLAVVGWHWRPTRLAVAPELARVDQPAGKLAVVHSPTMPSSKPAPLLGETILQDYANPKLPPENDLTLIARLMDNFTLLVKSAADRPLSANEDWAAALRGLNPAHERFLPDQSRALNAQGQLVDRWGSPLFFHALGERRFELRSAGPDKTMWTADDLHRNADGSFRRGAELAAPSLLDAATRGKLPPTAP